MATLRFYKCDVTAVTYSATSTNPSYPLSNLNSFYADELWMSANADTGQSLVLNYVLTGKTFIIFWNTNIKAIIDNGGTVKIQGAPDINFDVGLITVATNPPQDVPVIFSASNLPYWRIYYEKVGGLGLIPYVANFIVGTEVDLGTTNAYPYKPGKKSFETEETKALDGRMRMSQVFIGGHKGWKLPLVNIGTDSQDKLALFFDSVRGRFMPFYFTDANGIMANVHFDMDDDPTEVKTVGWAGSEILLSTILVE